MRDPGLPRDPPQAAPWRMVDLAGQPGGRDPTCGSLLSPPGAGPRRPPPARRKSSRMSRRAPSPRGGGGVGRTGPKPGSTSSRSTCAPPPASHRHQAGCRYTPPSGDQQPHATQSRRESRCRSARSISARSLTVSHAQPISTVMAPGHQLSQSAQGGSSRPAGGSQVMPCLARPSSTRGAPARRSPAVDPALLPHRLFPNRATGFPSQIEQAEPFGRVHGHEVASLPWPS